MARVYFELFLDFGTDVASYRKMFVVVHICMYVGEYYVYVRVFSICA